MPSTTRSEKQMPAERGQTPYGKMSPSGRLCPVSPGSTKAAGSRSGMKSAASSRSSSTSSRASCSSGYSSSKCSEPCSSDTDLPQPPSETHIVTSGPSSNNAETANTVVVTADRSKGRDNVSSRRKDSRASRDKQEESGVQSDRRQSTETGAKEHAVRPEDSQSIAISSETSGPRPSDSQDTTSKGEKKDTKEDAVNVDKASLKDGNESDKNGEARQTSNQAQSSTSDTRDPSNSKTSSSSDTTGRKGDRRDSTKRRTENQSRSFEKQNNRFNQRSHGHSNGHSEFRQPYPMWQGSWADHQFQGPPPHFTNNRGRRHSFAPESSRERSRYQRHDFPSQSGPNVHRRKSFAPNCPRSNSTSSKSSDTEHPERRHHVSQEERSRRDQYQRKWGPNHGSWEESTGADSGSWNHDFNNRENGKGQPNGYTTQSDSRYRNRGGFCQRSKRGRGQTMSFSTPPPNWSGAPNTQQRDGYHGQAVFGEHNTGPQHFVDNTTPLTARMRSYSAHELAVPTVPLNYTYGNQRSDHTGSIAGYPSLNVAANGQLPMEHYRQTPHIPNGLQTPLYIHVPNSPQMPSLHNGAVINHTNRVFPSIPAGFLPKQMLPVQTFQQEQGPTKQNFGNADQTNHQHGQSEFNRMNNPQVTDARSVQCFAPPAQHVYNDFGKSVMVATGEPEDNQTPADFSHRPGNSNQQQPNHYSQQPSHPNHESNPVQPPDHLSQQRDTPNQQPNCNPQSEQRNHQPDHNQQSNYQNHQASHHTLQSQVQGLPSQPCESQVDANTSTVRSEIEAEMERAAYMLPLKRYDGSSSLDPSASTFVPQEATLVQGNGKHHVMTRRNGMYFFDPQPSIGEVSTVPGEKTISTMSPSVSVVGSMRINPGNELEDKDTVHTGYENPMYAVNQPYPTTVNVVPVNQPYPANQFSHPINPCPMTEAQNQPSTVHETQTEMPAMAPTSHPQMAPMAGQPVIYQAYNPVPDSTYSQSVQPVIYGTPLVSTGLPGTPHQTSTLQNQATGTEQQSQAIFVSASHPQTGFVQVSEPYVASPHMQTNGQFNSPVQGFFPQMVSIPTPMVVHPNQMIPIAQPGVQIPYHTVGTPVLQSSNVQHTPTATAPNESLVSNPVPGNVAMVYQVQDDPRPPRIDPQPVTVTEKKQSLSSLMDRVDNAIHEVQETLHGSKKQRNPQDETWKGVVLRILRLPSEFFMPKPNDRPEIRKLRDTAQVISSFMEEVQRKSSCRLSEEELANEVVALTSPVLSADLNQSQRDGYRLPIRDSAVKELGPVASGGKNNSVLGPDGQLDPLTLTRARLVTAVREFARVAFGNQPSQEDEGFSTGSENSNSPKDSSNEWMEPSEASAQRVTSNIDGQSSANSHVKQAEDGAQTSDVTSGESQSNQIGALSVDVNGNVVGNADHADEFLSPSNVPLLAPQQNDENDRRSSMGNVNIVNRISYFESKAKSKENKISDSDKKGIKGPEK